MKLSKKTIALVTGALILGVLVIAVAFYGKSTVAQDCSAYENQAIGNLAGYIIATNLPSSGDQNKIWVSSQDDPWDGGPDYGVTYDRNLHLFSGRGWNEGLRVWVDFDFGTSDQARVLDASATPIGGFAWGYWQGQIRGLDGLEYSTNNATFVGPNPFNEQCVSGQCDDDTPIGLGELDFANVEFLEEQVPTECQEYIDVTANNSTNLILSSCGTSVGLKWNSNNVVVGSCHTDDDAPWPNPGASVNETNTTPLASDLITTENSPAYFKIICTGLITNTPVTGTAIVSCTDPTDPIDPTDNVHHFDYIES